MGRVDTRTQRELYTPLHSLMDLWVWPGTTQGSGEGFLIDPKRRQGGVKMHVKFRFPCIFLLFSPHLVIVWDQSGSLPQTPEWYQATLTCPLESVGGCRALSELFHNSVYPPYCRVGVYQWRKVKCVYVENTPQREVFLMFPFKPQYCESFM